MSRVLLLLLPGCEKPQHLQRLAPSGPASSPSPRATTPTIPRSGFNPADPARSLVIGTDKDTEGAPGSPHPHEIIKKIDVSAIESDASEVASVGLGRKFPHGLFVAMSHGRDFQFYGWEDLAGSDLRR